MRLFRRRLSLFESDEHEHMRAHVGNWMAAKKNVADTAKKYETDTFSWEARVERKKAGEAARAARDELRSQAAKTGKPAGMFVSPEDSGSSWDHANDLARLHNGRADLNSASFAKEEDAKQFAQAMQHHYNDRDIKYRHDPDYPRAPHTVHYRQRG